MSDGARAMLFLVALYAVMGVNLPYLPVWLREAKDLSGAEIGAILSGATLARIVTGPALAAWGEGRTVRRAIRAFMLAMLAAFAGLAFSDSVILLFAIGFVALTCLSAAVPFIEILAFNAARTGPLRYGFIRGVGSASFVVANLAGGFAIARFGPEGVILWLIALSALCLAAAQILPRGVQPPRTPLKTRLSEMGALFARPGFARFALAVGAIQAAHAFYYGFSANVWRDQGVGDGAVGALWAWAVIVEIALLLIYDRFGGRWDGRVLILLGGLASVVRYAALAVAPPSLPLLGALQMLHAGTFGLTHLGTLKLLEASLPDHKRTTGFAVVAALSSGTFLGLATLGAGPLFDAYGAGGYLAMSALGGVGLILALGLRLKPASLP